MRKYQGGYLVIGQRICMCSEQSESFSLNRLQTQTGLQAELSRNYST